MSKADTPMMKQWQACKKSAPGALLLFRLGDFYEAFFEDAELLSKHTGVTLTKRSGTPMSGIPVQSLDSYLPKLVDQGLLVAIAEQVGVASGKQKMMERKVVRTISAGTTLSTELLEAKKSNYFASIHLLNQTVGIAFLEMTTRKLLVAELPMGPDVFRELSHKAPSEFLFSKKTQKALTPFLEAYQETHRDNVKDEWYFELEEASRLYTQSHTLERDPLYGKSAATIATGALLKYLQEEMHTELDFVSSLQVLNQDHVMKLGPLTLDHLDIDSKPRKGEKTLSLISHLDFTKTAMGARMLREWVLKPLTSPTMIHQRQEALHNLITDYKLQETLKQTLGRIADIERIAVRISSLQAGAKELLSLACSLEKIPELKQHLLSSNAPLLGSCCEKLSSDSQLAKALKMALVEDPPTKVGEKRTIRQGYHEELDEYYRLKENSQAKLLAMQEELKVSTGIKTLKLVFSKTFGYCIEVSKGASHLVPDFLERRQTLVNAERYTYEALKTFEEKLMSADEHILSLERSLLRGLVQKVIPEMQAISEQSALVAKVDCLLSLSLAAKTYHYSRPQVDDSTTLTIEQGRHPLIEKTLLEGTFIANDVHLDADHEQIRLITGPNMAGKSTYIRQVALLCIMVQIGSYIPCKRAQIGIIDQVFTRIGASDNLMLGDSTFMVEMKETAHILHHATARSLVILDEIGRGTSTYDGIAIAKAVVEYLLQLGGCGVKTLFATHYSELCALSYAHPKVKNYSVAAKTSGDTITFLHQVMKGPASKSYGVHVAKLAGLPAPVLAAANTYLKRLEESPKQAKMVKKEKPTCDQMSFLS